MRKILAAIMLMTTFTVWAGDFEDGMAAYDRKDYATAVAKFTSAADQGDAFAQTFLGIMYDTGQGVAQDYVQAVRWYTLAAEQGLADAQFNLALMHELGQGVAQNYIQAHVWFNLAAAQGDKEAVDKRNRVAKQMTPQQIAQAQKLATECLARNYKGCD